MNHKQLQILVSSFVDGEITESDRFLVDEHIKNCLDCRTFVEQIHQMREGISAIGDVELAPGFAARVRNMIVRQEEQSEKWLSIERLARNTVFAIAFVMLIIFFIADYNNISSPGISEVLIDGTDSDSIAAQVLLNPGDLSKSDLLYAVMTK
jgi:predicted anti-sigma-YlaC factor YlaD